MGPPRSTSPWVRQRRLLRVDRSLGACCARDEENLWQETPPPVCFTHMEDETQGWSASMNFGVLDDPADVIKCGSIDRSRGLGSARGRKLPFLILNEHCP